MITLGRVDICCEVSMISSCLALPPHKGYKGHQNNCFTCMFSYYLEMNYNYLRDDVWPISSWYCLENFRINIVGVTLYMLVIKEGSLIRMFLLTSSLLLMENKGFTMKIFRDSLTIMLAISWQEDHKQVSQFIWTVPS